MLNPPLRPILTGGLSVSAQCEQCGVYQHDDPPHGGKGGALGLRKQDGAFVFTLRLRKANYS
jgi:hypothetical protein